MSLWYLYLLPREPLQKKPIDYIGVLLIISSLLCFITPLIYGRTFAWAWWILACIGLSFILFSCFILYEKKQEQNQQPVLLSIQLIKNKAFAYNLPILLFYNFTAGLFICYPYYLQMHLQWSVLAAGLAIVPYGFGFFLGPIIFAKIPQKPTFWIQLALGLLFFSFVALGCFFYATPQPSFPSHLLFFFAGLGHGIIMPVMMRESIHTIPIAQAGEASGIISTTIQVGSVLGGSIIGTLFFTCIETIGFSKALALALATIGFIQLLGFCFFRRNTKKLI